MSASVEAVLFALDASPVGAMPMALLPVAGKPILAHRIDELRALGITHLTIATAFPGAIRAVAEALPLYELDWRIETPARIRLRRARALVLSADRLSEPATARTLVGREDQLICARDGRMLAANIRAARFAGGWALPRHGVPGFDAVDAACRAPDSVPALVDLNRDVLRGAFSVPHVPGLKVAPGIYLESLASACPANIRGCAHVGDGARLHPTARIADTVVGAGARIGAHVSLDRCVVSPGARVPTGSRLSEAFVLPCGAVLRQPRLRASMRRAA